MHDDDFDIVARVIDAWDPWGFFSMGAPDDEYEPEVRAIVKQRARITSALDAAHVVSRVFRSAFANDERFVLERCMAVGERLFAALEKPAVRGDRDDVG